MILYIVYIYYSTDSLQISTLLFFGSLKKLQERFKVLIFLQPAFIAENI